MGKSANSAAGCPRVALIALQAGQAPLLVWVESPIPSKKTNAYWGLAESEMRHFNGAAKQVGLVGHTGAPFHLLDLAAIVDGGSCQRVHEWRIDKWMDG